MGRLVYEIETRHLRVASGERTPPNLWTPPSLPLRGGIEEREFAWGGRTPPSLPFKGRDKGVSGSPLGEGKTFLADF